MSLKQKISGLRNLIKFNIKRTKLFNRYLIGEVKYKTYGTLNAEQMRYIDTFSQFIYPPSDEKEKMQLSKVILKWTKERTEIDGYFEEYDEFINIIKVKTKRNNNKFYDSSPPELTKLLDDLYCKTNIYNFPISRNPKILFRFIIYFMFNRKKCYHRFILETVRKDLIKGIFSSELGWTLVGYKSWPGIGGEYTDYTEPPKLN
jgi:hypothetical protein